MRLKAEGKDGRYMYKKLVGMMWHDVEERMKNLGVCKTPADQFLTSPCSFYHKLKMTCNES